VDGLGVEEQEQARRVIKELLGSVERQELGIDGAVGRQIEAHLRGALLALEAVDR
jgi:hypothetical protein